MLGLGERRQQRLGRRASAPDRAPARTARSSPVPSRGPPTRRPPAPPARHRPRLSRPRQRPPGASPPARPARDAGAARGQHQPLQQQARARAGRAPGDPPSVEIGNARDAVRVAARDHQALLPPPEVHQLDRRPSEGAARHGSFHRPLATSSRCRAAASAAPRASATRPLTLPRGPGTTETASPTARSSRSSAGSSLPPTRSARASTRQPAARTAPPTGPRTATAGFPTARRHREAPCTPVRRSPPSTRPRGRASARRAWPHLRPTAQRRSPVPSVLRARRNPSVSAQQDTDGPGSCSNWLGGVRSGSAGRARNSARSPGTRRSRMIR